MVSCAACGCSCTVDIDNKILTKIFVLDVVGQYEHIAFIIFVTKIAGVFILSFFVSSSYNCL